MKIKTSKEELKELLFDLHKDCTTIKPEGECDLTKFSENYIKDNIVAESFIDLQVMLMKMIPNEAMIENTFVAGIKIGYQIGMKRFEEDLNDKAILDLNRKMKDES